MSLLSSPSSAQFFEPTRQRAGRFFAMDNRTSSLSDSGTAFENVPMDNKPRGAGAGIEKGAYDDSKVPFMTARTFFMCILVSMGGICFGYDTGLWSNGVRNTPVRVRVRMSRKRNEDE